MILSDLKLSECSDPSTSLSVRGAAARHGSLLGVLTSNPVAQVWRSLLAVIVPCPRGGNLLIINSVENIIKIATCSAVIVEHATC